jgi:hypothetical protein
MRPDQAAVDQGKEDLNQIQPPKHEFTASISKGLCDFVAVLSWDLTPEA